MAVCVAVVGKDNSPLFIKCRSSQVTDSDLEYHYIVSSSLDIIEERVQSSKNSLPSSGGPTSGGGGGGGGPETTRELYLGPLTAQEEYKVYGYMTNTRIKFIIVIEENTIPIRENDIRMMFRKLHSAFRDLMSNPFYNPGTLITSERFLSVVETIIVKF